MFFLTNMFQVNVREAHEYRELDPTNCAMSNKLLFVNLMFIGPYIVVIVEE